MACANNTDHNNTDNHNKPVSLVDSINRKVNEGHDQAMPKMGDIVSPQKLAQHIIDSLQKQEPINHEKIAKIQKATKGLENINGSMYNWVEQFDFELF